jgi:hypothetical protein
MANQEVKLVITTDASGAVKGMKNVTDGVDKLKNQTTAVTGTIRASWVNIASGITIVREAIDKLHAFVDLAGVGVKVKQTEDAFASTSKAIGADAEEIRQKLKIVTNGTVVDSDLMQKAMKAMSAGMDPQKVISIGEIARLSARRMGIDVGQAYSDIVDAVETMRTKSLRAYGLMTKDQQGLIDKAKAAGAEIDLLKVIQANYDDQLKRTGPIMENAAERFQQYKAHLQEVREEYAKMAAAIMDVIVQLGRSGQAAAKYGQGSAPTVARYGSAAGASAGAFRAQMDLAGAPQSAIPQTTGLSVSTGFSLSPSAKELMAVQSMADSAKRTADDELRKAREAVLAKPREEWKKAVEDWRMEIEKGNPLLSDLEKKLIDIDKQHDALVVKAKQLTRENKAAFDTSELAGLATKAKEQILLEERLTLGIKAREREVERMIALDTTRHKRDIALAETALNNQAASADMADALASARGSDTGILSIENRYTIQKSLLELQVRESILNAKMAGDDSVKAMEEATRQITLYDQIDALITQLGLQKEIYAVTKDRAEAERSVSSALADLALRDQKKEGTRAGNIRGQLDIYGADLTRLRAISNPDETVTARMDETVRSMEELRHRLKLVDSTFGEGIDEGMKQWLYDARTTAEMASDIAKGTADATKDAFKGLFHDMRTGELKSFEDYFASFADRILSIWEDMIAEMAVKAIFNPSSIGSSGSPLSSLFSTGLSLLGIFGGVAASGSPGSTSISPAGQAAGSWGGGMPSSIPGYAEGTDYVPYTGLYRLHQGEAVVPRENNTRAPGAVRSSSSKAPVIVNMTVQTIDASSFSGYLKQNKRALADALGSAFADNHMLRRSR